MAKKEHSMQYALELLKQQAELQRSLFPNCNWEITTPPFSQFRYSQFQAADPEKNQKNKVAPEIAPADWSIKLLAGTERDSCSYVLRQNTATALVNPRFATLSGNYSPALQTDLGSCELLIVPTPAKIIGWSLRLEQLQKTWVTLEHPKNRQQKKKKQHLAKKQRQLERQLQSVWAEFARDIFAVLAFIQAKQARAQELQVYCSEPVIFSLYRHLQTGSNLAAVGKPYRNSQQAALHALQRHFDSIRFFCLHTLRYSDKYRETHNLSKISLPEANLGEHASQNARSLPQSFYWTPGQSQTLAAPEQPRQTERQAEYPAEPLGDCAAESWGFALVLEPHSWRRRYTSKICVYLAKQQLFMDIELCHVACGMQAMPSCLQPKSQLTARPKRSFAAVWAHSRLFSFLRLQDFLLPPGEQGELPPKVTQAVPKTPSPKQLPEHIGLCQFCSARVGWYRRPKPILFEGQQGHKKHRRAKFCLQGKLASASTTEAKRQSGAPLKFFSPAAGAASLQSPMGLQHTLQVTLQPTWQNIWPQEKALWQALQQAAAHTAELAEAQQKSFCLLVEREVRNFLGYIELLQDQHSKAHLEEPWRKGFHSKATMQQPLTRSARQFWRDFFHHSKATPFPAVLLWHLWSQLEPALAPKLKRKRKIARFLRQQQSGFEQLLNLLGIQREWRVRAILHYRPSVQSLAELCRLPAVLMGENKIEGAVAWRKFWQNAHKEWPVAVSSQKLYCHWPNWAERLEQFAGDAADQLLFNIQQQLAKEVATFQRICKLEAQLQQFRQRTLQETRLAAELLGDSLYGGAYNGGRAGTLLWQFSLRVVQPYLAALASQVRSGKAKLQFGAFTIGAAMYSGWLFVSRLAVPWLYHGVYGWLYRGLYRGIYQSISRAVKGLRQSRYFWQERIDKIQLQQLDRRTARANAKTQAKAEAQQQKQALARARQQHREAKAESARERREAAQKFKRARRQRRQAAAAARTNQKAQQLRKRNAVRFQHKQARQEAAMARHAQRQRQYLQKQEQRQLRLARWNDRYQVLFAPLARLSHIWNSFYWQNRRAVAGSACIAMVMLVAVLFVPREVYGDMFRAARQTWTSWQQQRNPKPVVFSQPNAPARQVSPPLSEIEPESSSSQPQTQLGQNQPAVEPQPAKPTQTQSAVPNNTPKERPTAGRAQLERNKVKVPSKARQTSQKITVKPAKTKRTQAKSAAISKPNNPKIQSEPHSDAPSNDPNVTPNINQSATKNVAEPQVQLKTQSRPKPQSEQPPQSKQSQTAKANSQKSTPANTLAAPKKPTQPTNLAAEVAKQTKQLTEPATLPASAEETGRPAPTSINVAGSSFQPASQVTESAEPNASSREAKAQAKPSTKQPAKPPSAAKEQLEPAKPSTKQPDKQPAQTTDSTTQVPPQPATTQAQRKAAPAAPPAAEESVPMPAAPKPPASQAGDADKPKQNNK